MKNKFFDIFEPIFEVGDTTNQRLVSGLHSGNLGDIIYALPTIKELGIDHLILNVCADPNFRARILRSDDAKAIARQLVGEVGLIKVTVVATNLPFDHVDLSVFDIDYNLDSFRISSPDPSLHLVYQHALPFGITPNTSIPWVTRKYAKIVPHEKYMVLSVTPRYRRFPETFYQEILSQIPPEKIWIIGTPLDRGRLSGCQGNWMYTNDFSNIFSLIQNASIFVGNPSFPYAIAEAMKLPRIVEVPEIANAYPLDATGHLAHMYPSAMLSEMIKECLALKSSLASDFYHLKVSYEKQAEELSLRRQELHQIKNSIGWRIIWYLNRFRTMLRWKRSA